MGMTKSDTILTAAGRMLVRFRDDESGATAIEYAMIASGVGATVAATVYLLGNKVQNLFSNLNGLMP
jgi:pilus assembly protein Flp/PilA